MEFKEQYEWEQEQQRRAEKRMEELAQMEVGYFEASPSNDEDYPSVEVNVYLTEEQTGWIISCSCVARAFPKYKNIFTTIIGSFRRI